jgi:hypothetical protein
MKLLFILSIIAVLAYATYWFFLKGEVKAAPKNDPLPPFNPNPEDLQPKGDISKEPDYIYKYAGETINRDGKTYTWDRVINKYIPVK